MDLYQSERNLVDDVSSVLLGEQSPWRSLTIAYEFNYPGGRTDIIAVDNDSIVIAFEAKLKRWRDALQQAYKNTAFAHYSYVVLPASSVSLGLQTQAEFSRYSIGLCVAQRGKLIIVIEAPSIQPLLPWITERAVQATLTSRL